MASTEIEEIIDQFNTLTHKRVKFLTVQEDAKEDIKQLVKSLYDYTKSQEKGEKKEKKDALSELIVEGFDEEQIWQQIELQNAESVDHLVWEVANGMSVKSTLEFPIEVPQEQDVESEEEISESEHDNTLSDYEKGSEELSAKKKKSERFSSKVQVKTSVVDDKFFKLQEMENFLLKEEKMDRKKADSDSDDESIDMFEEVEDEESGGEEGGKDMMYNDFFSGQDDDQELHEQEDYEDAQVSSGESEDDEMVDEPEVKKTDKRVKFADMPSDEDTEADDSDISEKATNVNGNPNKEENKSEFELRQQRLQQHITRLEEKTLKDAPWQLKGEIDATKRPQNSLLQEVVDFDLTTRPPPVITEQTTITLEDLIKQRVKDKAWDDVQKKEKPVDDQLQFRKPEVLDHSKSKLSLAQVYEAEYLKQKQALTGDKEEEKEPESHTQIREAMSKLFTKLDALCHYHYTPKPAQAEVKIISNTPAISMEEVAPVATSDAALLAPEEVKRKRKGDLMSKEERTQADKNRERKKKKKLQREKGKVVKVTEHRNTKKAVEASDKSLKTSKAFFQQLNDDASSLIRSNKNKRNVKNKGQ